MTRRKRLYAWSAFWLLQALHLAAAFPLLGGEAAVALSLFQIGLTGSVLTALLREERR